MLKNKLNNIGLALDGKREDFKEAAAADLTTGTAVTNGGCGGVSGVPVGMRPIDAYFQPCGANGGATGLGEGSGVGMGQGAGVCGKPIDAYFQPVGATGQALQGTVNNGHAGMCCRTHTHTHTHTQNHTHQHACCICVISSSRASTSFSLFFMPLRVLDALCVPARTQGPTTQHKQPSTHQPSAAPAARAASAARAVNRRPALAAVWPLAAAMGT